MQHAPLCQRRVLEFVQQEMLDGAVEAKRQSIRSHRFPLQGIGEDLGYLGKTKPAAYLLERPKFAVEAVEEFAGGRRLVRKRRDQDAACLGNEPTVEFNQV